MGVKQSHLSQLQHQGGSSTVIPFCNQFLSRQADQFSDTTVHFNLQRMVLWRYVSIGQPIFRLVARKAACLPEQLC